LCLSVSLLSSFHSKDSATTLAEQGMTLFHDLLDILRIEVATTNDDEIFESPYDIEFFFNKKTKISGSQKGPLVGL
jgi:hypothetical protein